MLLERRRHPAQSCARARADGGHTAPRQIPQPSATRRSRTHGSPSVRRRNGLHCVAHSNPCRPTKRPDRPSVLDQHHGGCRSEVAAPRLLRILPAVPLYSPVDRYLQGQVSTENGVRLAGQTRHISPHRNSDHALDLPIDESFPLRTARGSMPETPASPSRVSRTHDLGGQALLNALPHDARRAAVHPRCPSAPPARSR